MQTVRFSSRPNGFTIASAATKRSPLSATMPTMPLPRGTPAHSPWLMPNEPMSDGSRPPSTMLGVPHSLLTSVLWLRCHQKS